VLQTELRAQAPDVPVLKPAPDRSGRGGVSAALLPTVTDESEWVAAQAAALLALPDGWAPDGKLWPDNRLVGVRPSDIAVLCRKRSQFLPLRQALEVRGIPCEVVGLGGLLSVPEVQDVVATLRVLHDAASSDALARLLTGPRWRIGPRDLVALGRRARDLAHGVADSGDSGADPGNPDGADPGNPGNPGNPDGAAAETHDPLAEAVTDLTTADSAVAGRGPGRPR
jgi:DNA helicase-2/ATP-dependent DNA helicase PcrA